nr:hypothetical protein [Tanacetum cinerariifolium]
MLAVGCIYKSKERIHMPSFRDCLNYGSGFRLWPGLLNPFDDQYIWLLVNQYISRKIILHGRGLRIVTLLGCGVKELEADVDMAKEEDEVTPYDA